MKFYSTLLSLLLLSVFTIGGLNAQNADFNPNAISTADINNPPYSLSTTASWTTLTASPHAVSRSCCVYVLRNDTGYVFQFGGGAGAQLTNVARYNIRTATWTNNLSVIPASISAGSAIADGDSVIYVIGGNATVQGKTLKYNIAANTWATLSDMPIPSTDMLGVKYQDTLIYAICGGDGTFAATTNNAVRMFRMRSATWTSLANFPISVAMMGGGIYKDTIITAGGWLGAAPGNPVTYKGVINPANPTSITWTTLANYPAGGVTRMASYVCLIPGQGVGIACSGGAVDGGVITAASNFWNFCTSSWQTLPVNSLARSNLKGAGAGDSVMYQVGGFTTVGVGQFEKLTFSQIDGTCSGGPPPPTGGRTLVLMHDSTTVSAQRKADRDTMNRYLAGYVGLYTIKSTDTNTTFDSLSNYSTIIIQETSFDAGNVRWIGAAGRAQIKAWLAAGTPANKRSLIAIGADLGYNYSRVGSLGRDLEFAETYGKYIYRLDNAPGATLPAAIGVTIDAGNSRALTSSPPGGSYWPDGCSIIAGGSAVLYRWQNHTALDSVGAIGNVQPGYVVANLFADPRYFTSDFNSVFRAIIEWVRANGGTITGVNNNTSFVIPETFNLSQNYPNPFNPSTKINYSIPKSGHVSIIVYDVLGKEVAKLVNEFQTLGVHEVVFNGSNFSSGTYFYRLETNGFVNTKKMFLVK